MTEHDLYLFHEGNLFHSYQLLGAHRKEQEGRINVRFSVWAPHARAVSVVGDFNQWNGNAHRMKRVKDTGIWELFIPELGEGTLYKYEIKTDQGKTLLKADPYAFYSELRPNTASIIYDLHGYKWHDQDWQTQIKSVYNNPLNIYEVHFGSWKKKRMAVFIPIEN